MTIKKNVYIDPTALVEEDVTIGDFTHIWHHCHVRTKSILGKNVSLGKDVFIDQGVEIGNGCRIQNGVSVYRGVIIKDWAFVGPNVTFTNDRFPRAGAKSWKLSETLLNPGCSIGAGSIIICDITIGSFALVGAASVVTDDIPPFHLVYGLPAKIVTKICACGSTKLPLDTLPKDYLRDCCHQTLKDEVIAVAREQIKILEEEN